MVSVLQSGDCEETLEELDMLTLEEGVPVRLL
jgi:hypothetical protein